MGSSLKQEIQIKLHKKQSNRDGGEGKSNLFDGESEASDGDGDEEEEEEGDAKERRPGEEGHGEPATPRPALLVGLVV